MATELLLKLHEAIAVVLLNREDRTANFEEIANEINRRNLYRRKDGEPLPSYQVMQRSTLSGGQYQHLFESVGKNSIKVRNYQE
ncbi:MAG: hypothetical protein ACO1OO_13030 [Flavisolibacter sp.]